MEEHTHIVEYKLDTIKEILARYADKAKIVIIDDFLEGLRFAKKYDSSVFTIWMKRGEYAHTQETHSDFTPDVVVENMNEIIPLITAFLKNDK